MKRRPRRGSIKERVGVSKEQGAMKKGSGVRDRGPGEIRKTLRVLDYKASQKQSVMLYPP